MRILLFALSIIFGSYCVSLAHAQDCNEQCCREIRITPFDRNTICDPGCKTTCETSKVVGVPGTPHLPSIVNEVVKLLEQHCASGFEVVTKYIILSQGFYPSNPLLDQAKELLLKSNLFSPGELNGVTFRWCSLRADTSGMTPDRDLVCISDKLRQGNILYIAITMAHEMIHVQQYRSRGTDNFKCEYSKEYVRCNGCQDDGHPLEHEAYEFERNIAKPKLSSTFIQLTRAAAPTMSGALDTSANVLAFCHLYEGVYEFTNYGPGTLQIFENCGGCRGIPPHGGALAPGETRLMALNNGPTRLVPLGATQYSWREIGHGGNLQDATCP